MDGLEYVVVEDWLKADLKPGLLLVDGGGRGGRELMPGGGGYDMMNKACLFI